MGRNDTKHPANRVKAHRLARELTQAQLAAQVGVSRQTVNSLEAGDYSPSVYLALRVAEVLAASVEELFAPAARMEATTGDSHDQAR